MNLETIHFIIGHYLHIIPQKANGDKFTSYIQHKSTLRIIGPIYSHSLRHRPIILFHHLKNGPSSPKHCLRRCTRQHHPIRHIQIILLPILFCFFSSQSQKKYLPSRQKRLPPPYISCQTSLLNLRQMCLPPD